MLLVDSEQADSYADSLDSPPSHGYQACTAFILMKTGILSVGGESHPAPEYLS